MAKIYKPINEACPSNDNLLKIIFSFSRSFEIISLYRFICGKKFALLPVICSLSTNSIPQISVLI